MHNLVPLIPLPKNFCRVRAFSIFSFLKGLTHVLLCIGILQLLSSCTPSVDIPSLKTQTVTQHFTNFETEPVRPLALSGDHGTLYALNTFDDRLEVFTIENGIPIFIGETLVGLRPVALALKSDKEAWVVNHLSDSVSIVDLSNPARPRVVRTLSTGDEPRGIVVAGPDRQKIFIACARRGAESTPGVGRAEIWIFDAFQPHVKPKILTLFGMKPRALAVSPDGRFVYAGIFHSGNATATTSGEEAVRLGMAKEQGRFTLNFIRHKAVPKTGSIVAQKEGGWYDFYGQDWSSAIPFSLPDDDVFVIDAAAENPQIVDRISGVGTVLFDLAIQPESGELWVANTEAANLIPHEPQLLSKFATNRISRVKYKKGNGALVEPIDLNPHIDRTTPTGNGEEREKSLAQPVAILFHPDGKEAYVAAFGSGKIGILNASGQVKDRIDVGFGPGGLALNPIEQKLYVLNHLDASLSVVDLSARRTIAEIPLSYNPTPEIIRAGRPLLYNALLTSGHGDLSCATCHVFGDFDGLAWDLGNPEGTMEKIPNALKRKEEAVRPRQLYHPLKGPMMTQSLRGLANSAPYHWRGDRFGSTENPGLDVPSFNTFNKTFVDLLGRPQEFPDKRMEAFSRFAMTIHYPPNPNQKLDRSLSPSAQAGFDFYTGPFLSDQNLLNCADCHTLPQGSNRLINFEGRQAGRDMKTAHLRNVYQKVGRFNQSGKQITGFGLIHDGSVDTVVNFLKFNVFFFPGKTEKEKDKVRQTLNDYLMEFDTGMAPSVGLQVTLRTNLTGIQKNRLSLMEQSANAGDCDLVAHGWENGIHYSWLFQQGHFVPDRKQGAPLKMATLIERFHKINEPLTLFCIPPGNGYRTALDRNSDGVLNGDEIFKTKKTPLISKQNLRTFNDQVY